MRVYAEWIQENGKNYRRKTLLHFGDSVDLIGSAVLMNPGSAEPIKDGNFDVSIVKRYYEDKHKEELESENTWRLFKSDQTMGFLEKIFNGRYLFNDKNKIINLKGIIQLFNCYYFKEQDLENATEQFMNDPNKSEYIFNESKYFLDKPVYFGWGNVGTNGVFLNIAEKIFSEYDFTYTPIYNCHFMENHFSHPKTVNIKYKKNQEIKETLCKFYKLIKKCKPPIA